MALAQLAPWLNYTPQTFLGAMEAGTRSGLQARGQDISQSEAADRLRYAYDSLASSERQQNATAAAHMAQSQAAMELRKSQMEGLQDYREAMIGQRQQGLDSTFQRIQDLESYRQQREADRQTTEERLAKSAEAAQALREQGMALRESEQAWKIAAEARKAAAQPDWTKLLEEPPAKPGWSLRSHLPAWLGGIEAPSSPGAGTDLSGDGTTAAEVTRITKDGRKAVFDAETKKFIRYADEEPETTSSDTSHDEEE